MHREHKRNAAGISNAGLDALSRLDVPTVTRSDVTSDLGDADDRLARTQLLRRDAVIQEPLDVNNRPIRMCRVIEPLLAAKLLSCFF